MKTEVQTPDVKIKAAFAITQAIAESIRELNQVPAGVLYAHVMSKMDIEAFDRIIGLLKRSQLVSEENHILRWIGPVI